MSRRNQRLAEDIREEVAKILASEMKDPRLGFITVTRVALAADLRTARVLVSVMGDAHQRTQSLRALGQAAGWVRRELGRRLSIRHTPEVQFVNDEGIEATERVARLLAETEAAGKSDPEDE